MDHYMESQEKISCVECGAHKIEVQGEICRCMNCGKLFLLPKTAQNFRPMKIFLSYGHPENDICLRIRDALKERGHLPWIDQEKIKQGDDWREKITDGILDSQGVISCLSKHSVREPGVCLDELSIAIGVRGGNIHTILLEREDKVVPPASVCHRQWLDMTSWREKLEAGEEIFKPWFNEKMSQLFEVIESPESRFFVGQIEFIKNRLNVYYDMSRQKELLSNRFTGRRWLIEQIEEWLDDSSGQRIAILTGEPGIGKSAFAANFSHRNPRVAAAIFCRYDMPLYNNPCTIIMTLSFLLACRLPDYRKMLYEILDNERFINNMSPQELFVRLLSDPLGSCSINGGRESLCIVVDGIDERGSAERNILAETIGRFSDDLPTWLRFLIVSRNVTSVCVPLEGATQFHILGKQEQNIADIRDYFIEKLYTRYSGNPVWNQSLNALVSRSEGIFLYARLVTKGLLSGKTSLLDFEKFPVGLSKSFNQWFNWFFTDLKEYRENFRLPLGLILAAPEPMPIEEFNRILNWDKNTFNDFLLRIDVLLEKDDNVFGKKTICFSHKYVCEWLDSSNAGVFRSARISALQEMANRMYQLFIDGADSLTEYELLHFVDILENREMENELENVRKNKEFHQLLLCHGRRWEYKNKSVSNRFYTTLAHILERIIEDPNATLEDWRTLCFCYECMGDYESNFAKSLDMYIKCLKIVDDYSYKMNKWIDLYRKIRLRNKIGNFIEFYIGTEFMYQIPSADKAYDRDLSNENYREFLQRTMTLVDNIGEFNSLQEGLTNKINTWCDHFSPHYKINEYNEDSEVENYIENDNEYIIKSIVIQREILKCIPSLFQMTDKYREVLEREIGVDEIESTITEFRYTMEEYSLEKGHIEKAIYIYDKSLRSDEVWIKNKGILPQHSDIRKEIDDFLGIIRDRTKVGI